MKEFYVYATVTVPARESNEEPTVYECGFYFPISDVDLLQGMSDELIDHAHVEIAKQDSGMQSLVRSIFGNADLNHAHYRFRVDLSRTREGRRHPKTTVDIDYA